MDEGFRSPGGPRHRRFSVGESPAEGAYRAGPVKGSPRGLPPRAEIPERIPRAPDSGFAPCCAREVGRNWEGAGADRGPRAAAQAGMTAPLSVTAAVSSAK